MKSRNVKHRWVARDAFALILFTSVLLNGRASCQESKGGTNAPDLRRIDTNVLSDSDRQQASDMVSRDIERRRRRAIERENKAWANVETRADWEQFRDARIDALRDSLGSPFRVPIPGPKKLHVETTRTYKGDGYLVKNIVFETRPGLWVTANLYLPAEPKESMPAVLFSHSHHAPKTQGELQDMGMTWARQGWVVLAIDHLGHGERRQHPFVTSNDYPTPFRVSRQDYYFRYNVGLQLQLVGESYIGWMAWDLMRSIDLLLEQKGVDPNRVVLIGAVAGGGDPAGVTAALDQRISAVAPFNFGGPQPDYAIPADAEASFYYFGVAYWETTRCLRLGGRDGFAHWTIVGAVAPRRLIYSSEFAWDKARDPVWPRLEKVFELYGARDHLGSATGRGSLKGRPPENTHCTNVGVFHRRNLYPHLQRWFDMTPPAEEFQQRRETQQLMCLTPEVMKTRQPQRVHQLAGRLGHERLLAARKRRAPLAPAKQLASLRREWANRLGQIEPPQNPKVTVTEGRTQFADGLAIDRLRIELPNHMFVPLIVLQLQTHHGKAKSGVVAFARNGKQQLLKQRSTEIVEWLQSGALVCLPDLRGTGETGPDSSQLSLSARSHETTLSCREQVLGETTLAARLRDLRAVVRYAARRVASESKTVNGAGGHVIVWGDSLTETNPRHRTEVVPHGVENPNVIGEPTSGMLALLCALFEDDVRGVYASGTLASFESLLSSPFVYVPHDAIVPGALAVSDISDIVAAIAPRPVYMNNLIDGLNRSVAPSEVTASFAPAIGAFEAAGVSHKLRVTSEHKATDWLLRHSQDD